MEAQTLQIANIQKDEEFKTLPTRIMPTIKEAVGYENSLAGIHNLLKQPSEMGIIFSEGVFPLLVGLFQIFTGTKAFKESHAGSDTTHLQFQHFGDRGGR